MPCSKAEIACRSSTVREKSLIYDLEQFKTSVCYLQWFIISLKNSRVIHKRSYVLSVWSERKYNFVAEFFGRKYTYDDEDAAAAAPAEGDDDDDGDEKREGAIEAAHPP